MLVISLLACLLAVPPAQGVSVSVGPRERIYDYDTMRCADFDWPDIPVRAYRDTLGRVQLITGTGSIPNNRLVGPDFDHLTRDCTPLLTNSNNPRPEEYDDAEWLSGIYTPDGQEVFGLVHSEYHGQLYPGYCGDRYLDCRFTTITYAHSNDGNSYTQPASPDHLVASMPYRSVPGDGRYGYFSPSNIIQKDGFFYNMFLVSSSYKKQGAGVCIMRTQTLGNPKSWRAWDGEGFNVRFIDPYRESAHAISRHVCEPLPTNKQISRSIVWSTFLNKWVAVGSAGRYDPNLGKTVTGIYFSTSDDLIEWTEHQLLLATPTAVEWQCGDPEPAAYPSFVDPSSTDRNFATIDQTTHVYFTSFRRENCMVTSKRDLSRVTVQFTP